MDELRIVASIMSYQVQDPDDVPTHNEGVCRYWGAFDDSPCPDMRIFVVFNRQPKDENEAFQTVKTHFSE